MKRAHVYNIRRRARVTGDWVQFHMDENMIITPDDCTRPQSFDNVSRRLKILKLIANSRRNGNKRDAVFTMWQLRKMLWQPLRLPS